MELIIFLLAIIILLTILIARPFFNGAYRVPEIKSTPNQQSDSLQILHLDNHFLSWKFDPHEEKILENLLNNRNDGISVSQLNQLLNLKGKSAENQRQRRHLVIKELNTKLFVLLNIRECIVRVPEAYDSRKKQYLLLTDAEVYLKINSLLSKARLN